MQVFLKKIILKFFLLLSAYLIISLTIIFIVKSQLTFKLDRSIKYLFVGSSLSECAFNDSLIDKSKNISKSNNSYFYNYIKIKKILKDNPNNINSIFIDYSNFLIAPKQNESIWGYEMMNIFLSTYIPFLETDDLKILINNANILDLIRSLLYSIKYNLKKILASNYGFHAGYGSYLKLERDIKSAGYDLDFEINFEKGFSETNINYLKKITNLCKMEDIKIYFVRTPIHPNTTLNNEEELFRIKNLYFPGIIFLDFYNFELSHNEYGDQMHLNYIGAEVFSNWFNNEIKRL